jgi:CBS domain-containing protein
LTQKNINAFLLVLWGIIQLLLFNSCVNEENKTIKLVNKIRPSIVLIETYDSTHKFLAQGSGFFIDEKGIIITNNHVIEGAHFATAKNHLGDVYSIENITALDIDNDLVKLKVSIPKKKIKTLKLNSNLPSVGEDIIILGNPLGLESTVSTGIVSGIRNIPDHGDFIQVTAPISPGSSGGPVVNDKGEVIGVVTSSIPQDQGQNLNFAIPSAKIIDLQSLNGYKSLSKYADEISNPKLGYFPLIPNAKYVYNQKADWRNGISTIIAVYINQINAICFMNDFTLEKIEKGEIQWDQWDYPNINIGLGAYQRIGKMIYTFNIDMINVPLDMYREEVAEKLKKQKLLRSNLRVGDYFEVRKTWGSYSVDRIRVVGFETIEVPAGKFEDCAKLEILRTYVHKFNNYIPKTNKSIVWLAKNIGVVKWKRPTGIIDELISYYFPDE